MAGGVQGTLLANRYRIVKQLGQGGMGSVWLAEDTQLDNKLFAIKMLPSILVSNKRAYRQLKDEALVAMKLSHPNIVTLRAFEENNGNPFLVMDYIDGQTLDDYIGERPTGGTAVSAVYNGEHGTGNGEQGTGNGRARSPSAPQGGLPESDVLRILRPIAAALDYAHSKGVVHRDVKPGNVMIAKDGTPYILDFGIAREIQETMTRVTGKLSSGTLLYMSPEQLNGDAPKKEQDIYSFAAMVYECLKGEPPFSRGNIEFQIMNKQPEPLTDASTTGSLPVGVNGRDARSPSVAAGVMSGLAKKPEDRPPTCSAVLEGNVSRGGAETRRNEYGNGRARTPAAPVGKEFSRGGAETQRTNGAGKVLAVLAFVAAIAVGWLYVNARAARSTGGTYPPRPKAEVALASSMRGGVPPVARQETTGGMGVPPVAAKTSSISSPGCEAESERPAKLEHKPAPRAAAEKTERPGEKNQAREREMPRQKEVEARETEEAERAAETARGERKLDNARMLKDARAALSLLYKDPMQHGHFDSKNVPLTQVQQDLLSPLFNVMLAKECEYMSLLNMFSENHPEIKEKKSEWDKAVDKFKSVVSVLQSGLSQDSPVHDVREAVSVLVKEPMRYETVAMYLSMAQRKRLSPVFKDLVLVEADLEILRTKYAEIAPVVVSAKQKRQEILEEFKTLAGQCLENKQAASGEYIVKSGDTRSGTAFGHGTADKSLKALNGRANAEASREKALKALKEAVSLGALTYAKENVKNANTVYRRAKNELDGMKFADAVSLFDKAAEQFDESATVAKNVRIALDAIAKVPMEYKAVRDRLPGDMQGGLDPYFQNLSKAMQECDELCEKYAESNPKVVEKRGEIRELRRNFYRAVLISSAYVKDRTSGTMYYNVRAGDTLTLIASAFGMEIMDLKALNGLKGDVVNIGWSLKVSNVSLSPNRDLSRNQESSQDRERDDMLSSIKVGSVVNLVTGDSGSKSGVVTKNTSGIIEISWIKGSTTVSTEYPYSDIKDATVMPAEKFYAGRTPASIGAATRGGTGYGDAATESTVMKVLWWLKATQRPDGSWTGGGSQLANTAFAILTFLAHGEFPNSPSPYRKDFGPVVQKGIEWLIGSLEVGSQGVRMKGADGNEYAFLIATYALCEAYGTTKDPECKKAAMQTLKRIIDGQSPTGGWDYRINPKSTRDDLSFAGWALQALKAGKMAGLHPEGLDQCIKKAVKCLQTRSFYKDHFTYCANSRGHPGLTATGCLAMQLLGYGNSKEVRAALDYMKDWRPSFEKGGVGENFARDCPSPQYYCYYATQCKYQAGMKAGAVKSNEMLWQKWNAEMKKLYPSAIKNLPAKVKDWTGKEHKQGYFENKDQFSTRPVMDSCLVALQLMVYYRYPPNSGI